jgi:nucleotide-binding universal stress UspA family protein
MSTQNRSVVVTTDFSDSAAAAFPEAAKEAKVRGCALILLHVLNDWGIPLDIYQSTQPALVEQLRADLSANAREKMEEAKNEEFKGVPLKTVIEPAQGRPVASVVCEFAKANNAELIVAASRGHNVISEVFLGSVTHQVLHHAPCPVLVVHAPYRRDSE